MLRLSSMLLFTILAWCSLTTTTTAIAHSKDLPISITLTQLEAAFAGHCPTITQGEVISCSDALPYINDAIYKYGLSTRGQRAAYIANMAYEGAYLKYNYNLVTRSQGTRSILPATSLKIFVDANESIQKFWPGYPYVDVETIVDVLIQHKADFEPGAWWTVSGPRCAKVASRLSESLSSFITWEITCINGGEQTIKDRAEIYSTVYASIV
ncbi:hypothetical protein BGZ65_008054 [Modicella reniformis]|uniref:Uncharacterized protein n=1 Tax=Modicella reniformis TaxID=1440133 RepID=A0A9P6J538_9FUNG|nr:hypothetical protein BGZ65_008054 [Modicella reniformis]